MFGSWPNHDWRAHQVDFDWCFYVSGGVGNGTSDKIVSVAPEGVNEDERLFRDLVDPQTPYTSCLLSTDQLSARQRQKAVRTNNARLRSGERIVGLLQVETLWSIYSPKLPD